MADIYAPLAHRLGISKLNRGKLEAYSFAICMKMSTERIAKLLAEKRLDRDRYIHDVVETIKNFDGSPEY